MTRLRAAALLTALVCAGIDARADDASAPDAGAAPEAGAPAGDGGANPTSPRVMTFSFTATKHAQIAIWVESPDGAFLSTVAVTQAVSVRGIGNRPGATEMNSGYRWPYGRREGVLPVWANRRAAAGGTQAMFPRVIFQNRLEGYASRTCEDSTPDSYFCLSFQQTSSADSNLDAVSCATPFNSDKGRIITAADVAAGYKEPEQVAGQPAYRALSQYSVYPPRRDFTSCNMNGAASPCGGGNSSCQDNPTSATYSDAAHSAMPEIDAVTMATPPEDQPQTVMYTIPDDWPDGSYMAWLEINTEDDHNGTYSKTAYPTPVSSDWDTWAMTYGYPYRGQPSVVFTVPFTLGSAGATTTTSEPVGYGSVDGTDADPSMMHPMDSTITDDPVNSPGSGADRLRMPPGSATRLSVDVLGSAYCQGGENPAVPGGFAAAPVADPKHSYQWAQLQFTVPASPLPIMRYDVRTSTAPIVQGDDASFLGGLPAMAATASADEALVVPTGGAPGSPVSVSFGGLIASTHYWVAIRAVDACNHAGPDAVAELTTTKVNYTQLSGCFVATAAWGSAMAPEVDAMRRARDRLRPASRLFAAASEVYYQSGPAAARLIARSETARALVRWVLAPIGAAALVDDPTHR